MIRTAISKCFMKDEVILTNMRGRIPKKSWRFKIKKWTRNYPATRTSKCEFLSKARPQTLHSKSCYSSRQTAELDQPLPSVLRNLNNNQATMFKTDR